MKRNLLSLFLTVMTVLGLSQSAMALNSYAYGLKAQLIEDGKMILFEYDINYPAHSSVLHITNGEITRMIEGTGDEGHHFIEFPTDMFAPGDQLKWSVEVVNWSVTEPTEHSQFYRFYHPAGVVVDKNTNSPYFGRIYVTECMDYLKAPYVSENTGAGIYAFDPQLNVIVNADSVAGFKGGVNYMGKFPNGNTAYAPYRLALSDDGRLFVSGQNFSGSTLWEVNVDDLNAPFTPVLSGTLNEEDYLLYDAEGNFVAGQNVGLDVKGSGKDLQILTYSANKAATEYAQSGFRCDYYNIGQGSTTPNHIEAISGKYGIVYGNTSVKWDREGGLWFLSNRAEAKANEPTLVHINAEGSIDYIENNGQNRAGGGAICLSPDGKQLAMGTSGKTITIYDLSKDETGAPVLTEKYKFASNIGTNCKEIAWDYANNLYIVGNSGEYLKVFALPLGDDYIIETPAPEIYNLTIAAPQKVYVIGHTVANNYTWAANVGEELMLGKDGIYRGEITFAQTASEVDSPTGVAYFGLAIGGLGANDTDWEGLNVYRYGASVVNETIINKAPTSINKTDYSWAIANGTYDVEVDLSTMTLTVKNQNEVTVTYPEKLYLVGDVNGWNVTDTTYNLVASEELGEGVYKGQVTFPTTLGESTYFALGATVGDWGVFNENRYGPANDGDMITLNSNCFLHRTLTGAAYQVATSDKAYDITVNIPANTILVTISSGVNGAEVANATIVAGNGRIAVVGEVENVAIYTIGGVLVSTEREAEVASGAYVVVADGIATKVLVK